MDKAEAMYHEACILHSYWKFATQHAVHIYNWTSMKWLNWHTPYELLLSKILDILHLWVFSCGTYVYIPSDVQTNKLALKSKLMIYLGVAIGNECNHIFMWSPNNIIFTSAHALFDEAMFPHCKTQSMKHNTWIWQDIAPSDPNRLLLDMSNDDDPLSEQSSKASASTVECPETPEQSEVPPSTPWTSQHTPKQSPQALPTALSAKWEFYLDWIISMVREDILSSNIKMWKNSPIGRKLSTNNPWYQLFPNLVLQNHQMRYQI